MQKSMSRVRTSIPPEYKSAPQYTKAIEDRSVTGVFSVFGNIDTMGDRIWPGAFTKTLNDKAGKFLHLWQHDFGSPPIAKVTAIQEVGRDALPAEILSAYPEAVGGVEVTREYFDTPRANEVLTAIKAESPLQMSFGYDVVPGRLALSQLDDGTSVREIYEVRLWETSDVLWGANDATVASKMPLSILLHQINAALEEIKKGDRHSEHDYSLLDQAASLLVELGARNIKLIEPDKSDEPPSESRAEIEESISLTLVQEKARIFLLQYT